LQWTEENYRLYQRNTPAPRPAAPDRKASPEATSQMTSPADTVPAVPAAVPSQMRSSAATIPSLAVPPALQDRSNQNRATGGSSSIYFEGKRKPLPAWMSDEKATAEHMKKKMKTNSLFK